jgi:hypothetical protein
MDKGLLSLQSFAWFSLGYILGRGRKSIPTAHKSMGLLRDTFRSRPLRQLYESINLTTVDFVNCSCKRRALYKGISCDQWDNFNS